MNMFRYFAAAILIIATFSFFTHPSRSHLMALSVGSVAPDFSLVGTDLQPVTLSSFAGKKVVLAFFPAAFTGVCQAELCTFQGALQRLNGANATVLGICADIPFANKAFAEANGLQFPVLSDFNLAAITAYDVALHDFAGIHGLTRSVRATFIVGEDGTISYVEVTENPGVEPNYDALFSALGAA
jgi:peroxiredoxin